MSFKMKGFTPFTQVIQSDEDKFDYRPGRDKEIDVEPTNVENVVVKDDVEDSKPYLPQTEEEFNESYELPSDFKRNKFKDVFQFGEKGLLGKKYKEKKQDTKDGYRTQESIEASDFRDWDKKDDIRDKEYYDDTSNIKAFKTRDYRWREKDKKKKEIYPHHEGGKWDKNYVTIGTNNKAGSKGIIYRVSKEDHHNNRYYQEARQNMLDRKEALKKRREASRKLPNYLDPNTYDWNE